MPYAIVIFFDKSQSLPIDKVIEELAIKDVSPFMFEKSIPHITLAIYDEINGKHSKEKIGDFASKFKPVSLVFSHIGLFRSKMNAVFAAPIVTDSLLQHHKNFHDFFKDEGINSWENYLPNNWVPHCTLAFDVSENKTDEAFSICQNLVLPITINTSSIGIMEFEPVKEIFRAPFSN